jgi:hypothetical protein
VTAWDARFARPSHGGPDGPPSMLICGYTGHTFEPLIVEPGCERAFLKVIGPAGVRP